MIEELKAAAPSLLMELSFVGVRTLEEIGPAFSVVSRAHAQALYIIQAPLNSSNDVRQIGVESTATNHRRVYGIRR